MQGLHGQLFPILSYLILSISLTIKLCRGLGNPSIVGSTMHLSIHNKAGQNCC
jgi:hypothetical protein